jgi:sugar phosphate isomerase/epimerase
MKTLLLALLTALSAPAASLSGHLGLQLYSLRDTAKAQGWEAQLDQAKALGFDVVEGGSPPQGVTVGAYKAALAKRGLQMNSMHFGYDRLTKDLPGAVAEAQALGVHYACLPWIPHDGDFTEALARRTERDFDTFGAAFHAAGITFAYHPHGYEFVPAPGGGTLLDEIIRGTDPRTVSFEMDVFWIVHGGGDPVKLLAEYPDRWALMHIKDIRKGAAIGLHSGKAPASDDVWVGSGQVDWPAVLREAAAVGVQWYYIEDESDAPLVNLPKSQAYLKSLAP